MKKLFAYVIGIIMLVSTAIVAVTSFVKPQSDTPILAEETVSYSELPADCFYLTKEFVGDTSYSKEFGNAFEEEIVSDETVPSARWQCYAIVGLKPASYEFTKNGTTYKLGEYLQSHPYILLPWWVVNENGNTSGCIIGISYYYNQSQLTENGFEDYSDILPENERGAFSLNNSTEKNANGDTVLKNSCTSNALLQGVRIPSSYKYIGKQAFYYSNLKYVEFASNDVGSFYVGESIFQNSKELCSSKVSDSNNSLPSNIKDGTIPYCMYFDTKISSLYIPKTITTIGESAFSYCDYLEEVVFGGEGLNTIYNLAFAHDIKLTKFNIPSSVTTIYKGAFQNTFGLREIHIPSSVMTIGPCAFGYAYADVYSDEFESINSTSPRAIIFDGDRSDDVFANLSIDSDFMYDININGTPSLKKDHLKYTLCFYNKNTEKKIDNFNAYLRLEIFKETTTTNSEGQTVVAADSYSKVYYDHTTLQVEYRLEYEYYVKGEGCLKYLTYDVQNNPAAIAVSGSVITNTYSYGTQLLIQPTGYTIQSFEIDDNTIDLNNYTFENWYAIQLDSTGDTAIVSDKRITVYDEDQTNDKVYTDLILIGKYNLKRYTVTVIDNQNSDPDMRTRIYTDIWHDAKLSYMDEINGFVTIDGVRKYAKMREAFVFGELDPNNPNLVGAYSDSDYTNAFDVEEHITQDTTIYLRSASPDQIFTFTYSEDLASDGGYIISKLNQDYKNIQRVRIPSTYNGKPVLKIAERVFINNQTLTQLFFDDFENKDLNFYIDKFAFQGCTKLTYAELPSCNVYIMEKAFATTALDEIVKLGSVAYGTGGGLNYDYTALDNKDGRRISIIKSYDDTTSNAAQNSNFTLYDSDGNVVLKYSLFPRHYITLPSANDIYKKGYFLRGYNINSLKYLQPNSLSYDMLVKLLYPDSSDQFAQSAYTINTVQACKFDIQDNYIKGWSEEYSQYYVEDEISDPFSLVDIPDDDSIIGIAVGAFSYNTKITKVVLSKGIKYLQNGSFEGCTKLEFVEFPSDYDNLLSIYANVFFGCTNLKSFGYIAEDNYVKFASIASSAFRNCTSLSSFYMSNDSTLTAISDYAFSCSALRQIVVPSSVQTIGEAAFECTLSLDSVSFGENSNLMTIGKRAFSYSRLSDISFGSTKLNYIGNRAFDETKNLVSLSINADSTRHIMVYSDIFAGSMIKNLSFKNCIPFPQVSFAESFDSAKYLERIDIDCETVTVGSTNYHYQNYINADESSDGIVYKNTGDNLVIIYIPVAYRGSNGLLVIPDAVKDIEYSYYELLVFADLKNITSVKMENQNYDANKDYFVANGDLYAIDTTDKRATIIFVPKRTSNVYDVLTTITINEENYTVCNIDDFAFNANNYINVINFALNFPLDYVPHLYSDYITTIALSNNMVYIYDGNFKDLPKLSTIKISSSTSEGRSIYDFAGSAVASSVFATQDYPVIIADKDDVELYQSLSSKWLDLTVRANLLVRYNTNGGVILGDQEFAFGTKPVIATPTKIGYDFVRWCTDEDLTIAYNPVNAYSDLTLYAQYQIHEYNYTYMVDGKIYDIETVFYNKTPAGPNQLPTKKGKTFVGWKTEDGVDYDLSNNKAISDIVLYATFKTDTMYITKIIIIAVVALVSVCLISMFVVRSVRKHKLLKNTNDKPNKKSTKKSKSNIHDEMITYTRSKSPNDKGKTDKK